MKASRQHLVVAVAGPRQSGKTTLCRTLFPALPYASLEPLDERALAEADPHRFLGRFPRGAFIDSTRSSAPRRCFPTFAGPWTPIRGRDAGSWPVPGTLRRWSKVPSRE